MFKLTNTTEATINKRMAISYLEMYNILPAQRRLKDWKMREYKKHIEQGTFRKSAIVLALNKVTNETYLVDGQHRLKTAEVYDKTIEAYIEYYECEDQDDVVELYATFNTDLPRTIVDVAAVDAVVMGVGHWSRSVRSWVCSYAMYKERKTFHNYHNGSATMRERTGLMEKHKDAGNVLQHFYETHLHKKYNIAFKNSALANCILYSLETQDYETALRFWEVVFSPSEVVNDGTIVEWDNPARVFKRTISDAYANKHTSWWSSTAPVRARVAYYSQAAMAHFVKGNTIKSLNYMAKSSFKWNGAKAKK